MSTNVMLHISEKKTIPVDLHRPILDFITFHWSGRDAEKQENDLQELKNLRRHLENPAKQRSPLSRELILQNYYRALCVVETLFPISPAKGDVNNLTFTWYDAFEKKSIFKGKKKASQQNIHFEKAAVLFNLGAVYNKIGQSYDRSTEKGRWQAVEAFTRAAGVFAYLKDNAAPKASMGWSATVDLSVECAVMLEKLMLAQGQEIELENTMAEGSSPTECALIFRQVGVYYEEALAALKVEPLEGRIDRDWISHVQLKEAFFNAEASYRYGLGLLKKGRVSEGIARLKFGIRTLEEAKKSSKGGPAELFGAIEKSEANIQRSLDMAVADYESRVYCTRVPSIDSLSSLPSFSTVKPVLMDEVLDARNEKIFSGLARRVPVRSESDVYGQSASNLVAGSSLEGPIQKLLQIGGGTWDMDTAVRALREAHGNLERAVEYLCLGIPEQPEVPPVTRVPPGAQAANPPAQPAQPAQSAPGRLPSAMPQAVTVTPEEHEAIERLEALGFDPAIAQEVYFACDKNEVLAANNLLDHKHKYKD